MTTVLQLAEYSDRSASLIQLREGSKSKIIVLYTVP